MKLQLRIGAYPAKLMLLSSYGENYKNVNLPSNVRNGRERIHDFPWRVTNNEFA